MVPFSLPPPFLLAQGWEREGFFFLFFFPLSLASALFTSERLQPIFDWVQYLLLPFLDAWDPQPHFWAGRLCTWPRGRGQRSGQRRGQLQGTCPPCVCWISALLLLECWALIESFMGLKVLFWHACPLIPASQGDL